MKQRYALTIEMPSHDTALLRRLLKRLLRSLGIKCIAIRPVTADSAESMEHAS